MVGEHAPERVVSRIAARVRKAPKLNAFLVVRT